MLLLIGIKLGGKLLSHAPGCIREGFEALSNGKLGQAGLIGITAFHHFLEG